MASVVIEQAAAILLSSFTILFIVPGVLMRLFYTAPKLMRVAARGEIALSGPILVGAEALLWAAFAAAVYAAIYLFSHQAFFLATTSLTARICWVVGGLVVLVHFVLYFTVHRHRTEGVRPRMKNVIQEYVEQGNALAQYANATTEHEMYEILAHNDISAFDRRVLRNKALRHHLK